MLFDKSLASAISCRVRFWLIRSIFIRSPIFSLFIFSSIKSSSMKLSLLFWLFVYPYSTKLNANIHNFLFRNIFSKEYFKPLITVTGGKQVKNDNNEILNVLICFKLIHWNGNCLIRKITRFVTWEIFVCCNHNFRNQEWLYQLVISQRHTR